MMKLEDAQNIFDLREIAKAKLPKWLFEFVDRGTEEEVALHNNREAFERIKLVPRMLVDVSGRKLDTTVFGKEHKMPIGIAPTASNEIKSHRRSPAFIISVFSLLSRPSVTRRPDHRLPMQESSACWAAGGLSSCLAGRTRPVASAARARR